MKKSSIKNSPQYIAGYKIGIALGSINRKINPINSFGPIGIQGYNDGFYDGREYQLREEWISKYYKG